MNHCSSDELCSWCAVLAAHAYALAWGEIATLEAMLGPAEVARLDRMWSLPAREPRVRRPAPPPKGASGLVYGSAMLGKRPPVRPRGRRRS